MEEMESGERGREEYFVLGLSHQQKNEHELARENFGKAIACDESFSCAWFRRGLAAAALGSLEDALSDFSQAMVLKPTCVDYVFFRAHGLHEMNRMDLAVQDWAKVIRLEPKSPLGPRCRADAYFRLGMFDEASVDLCDAIKLIGPGHDSEKSQLWLRRSLCLCHLGHWGEATSNIVIAEQLDPSLLGSSPIWFNHRPLFEFHEFLPELERNRATETLRRAVLFVISRELRYRASRRYEADDYEETARLCTALRNLEVKQLKGVEEEEGEGEGESLPSSEEEELGVGDSQKVWGSRRWFAKKRRHDRRFAAGMRGYSEYCLGKYSEACVSLSEWLDEIEDSKRVFRPTVSYIPAVHFIRAFCYCKASEYTKATQDLDVAYAWLRKGCEFYCDFLHLDIDSELAGQHLKKVLYTDSNLRVEFKKISFRQGFRDALPLLKKTPATESLSRLLLCCDGGSLAVLKEADRLSNEKKYAESIPLYSKVVELRWDVLVTLKHVVRAHRLRGMAHFHEKNYKEAVQDFVSFILQPRECSRHNRRITADILLIRAFCQCHLGDFLQASRDVVKSSELDRRLSPIEKEQLHFESFFLKLETSAQDLLAKFVLGELEDRLVAVASDDEDEEEGEGEGETPRGSVLGRKRVCLTELIDFLERRPEQDGLPHYYLQRGLVCMNLRDYESASVDFSNCTSASLSSEVRAEAFCFRGLCCCFLASLDEGIDDILQSFALDGDFICLEAIWRLTEEFYQSFLGFIPQLEEVGRVEAERALQQLGQRVAEYYCAKLCEVAAGMCDDEEFEPAIVRYTMSIEVGSKSVGSFLGRGVLFVRLQRYSEAIPDFTEILSCDVSEADEFDELLKCGILVLRAFCHCQLDAFEQALADLNRAYQLDPEFCSLEDMDSLEDVDGFRGDMMRSLDRLEVNPATGSLRAFLERDGEEAESESDD